MTHAQAEHLRELMRADGVPAFIPTGIENSRRYFVRVVFKDGPPKDFRSEQAYRSWKLERDKAQMALERFAVEHGLIRPRARSPLDAMIDKACGLT